MIGPLQPWSTLCIGVAYLAMCSFGPRAMAPYKAFTGETLRPYIVTYNLGVAGLNLYIALELLATSRYVAKNTSNTSNLKLVHNSRGPHMLFLVDYY